MGAQTFEHWTSGNTPKEAFESARESALHDYGHSGYTGSIAEKYEFVLIPEPKVEGLDNALALADQLFQSCDERIDDKWGPAGCIPYAEGEYLFFGWASS